MSAARGSRAAWLAVLGFSLMALLPSQAVLGAMNVEVPISEEQLQAWYDAWPLKDRALEEKGDPLVVDMLEELNSWILTPAQITDFRRWPNDDAIVKSLIPVAGSSYRPARVPATLILANVVDNSNVCHVIAHLQTNRAMDENGRFNLLQVVLQVAVYAYDDNAEWMNAMAQQMMSDLRKGDRDTFVLLQRIIEALNNREAGQGSRLADQKSAHFQDCEAAFAGTGSAVATPEAGTPTDTAVAPSP
jgi:hypothetical protein